MIAEVKYLSYEFGLQLKQCEIVSLLTLPGTPQCNGVCEHRNRTLLDMVQSMMSLTDCQDPDSMPHRSSMNNKHLS